MSIYIFTEHNSGADAITGERIFPGEAVLITEYSNMITPYMLDNPTRVLKEETIVWLAEQAGYDVVKRDGGDSGDAEVVDGEDVGVGDGTVKAGAVKARGRKTVK